MKFRSRSFVEKNKERRKTFLWFFILAVSVLIGSFFWFVHAETFQVNESVVKGNSYVEDGRLTEIINQSLGVKVLGLIPRTNILFYPKAEIIKNIKSIPEVKDVKYSRVENSVRFDIEERKPAYIYCVGEYPVDDDCYFTDDSAFVFLKSPEFNNYPYLRLYANASSSATSSLGITIINERDINFARDIVEYLVSKEINPDAVSFSTGDVYFQVNIGDSDIYVAYKDNLESFKSKFEAITKDKNALKFIQSLEYLDLRLNTKIFLKEK